MSGGLADAVKNGPRATTARVREMEARIRLADHKASALQQSANSHARRAKGDGPMAKYHRAQAASLTSAADRQRATAADLRVKLAKVQADRAGRDMKHARHAVASTRDEFGTGPASGGQRPGQVANPGQPVKTGGGQVAKTLRDSTGSLTTETPDMEHEATIRSRRTPDWNAAFPGPMTVAQRRFFTLRDGGYTGPIDQDGHAVTDGSFPFPDPSSDPTKGPTMTAVSGEAVNIEQTEANIAQIKASIASLRGALEGLSGSLASGGLNKLAGTFSRADDGLDSLGGPLAEAEKYLADQRGIAEAAQAAGEMHADSSFYGAAGSRSRSGAWSRALDPRAGMTSQDRRAFNERVRRGDPSNGNR